MMAQPVTTSETPAQRDTSVCSQCNTDFTLEEALVSSLMSVQNVSSVTSDGQEKNFSVFTCRVCDHADLSRDIVARDIELHFNLGEVLYCQSCQDKFNKLKLGFLEELQGPTVPYSALLDQRKGMVLFSLQHVTPFTPECGFCCRPFGYLVPVLNRISHRLSRRGYECNICGEMRNHVKGMLNHAQSHVKDKVLFCRECIDHCRMKSDIYSPTIEEDAINALDNSKSQLSESEYRYFSGQLSDACMRVPPFPLDLSDSESSDDPVPKPMGKADLKKRNRLKKARLQRHNFEPSKGTHFLRFSFGKEVACFAACFGETEKKPDYTETSSRFSIFTCQTCKRELGGWGYAKKSIVRRESVEDERNNVFGQFTCQICNYNSEEWGPMERHILDHLGKNDVDCMECLKNSPKQERK